jgi:hypothetical protein
LAEYGCLVSRSLSQDHVAALAALFGWSVPDEGEASLSTKELGGPLLFGHSVLVFVDIEKILI